MHCKLCDNLNDNRILQIEERMIGLGNEFNYLECGSCGAVQLTEDIPNMSIFYPPSYYSFSRESSLIEYSKYFRAKHVVQGNSFLGKFVNWLYPEKLLFSLNECANFNKEARILDVGCGSGNDTIKILRKLGYNNSLGIDPYLPKEIKLGDNILVKNIPIDDLLKKGEKYDIIMFHHVFEHISTPREMLEVVKKMLNSDGVCIIRIPLADSSAYKIYKEHWVQLDAPRHYFLHTKKSLKLLCNSLGLSIEKIIYDSTAFQFWGSELYNKNIPLNNISEHRNGVLNFFSRKQLRDFDTKANVLNKEETGDQAIFYIKNS